MLPNSREPHIKARKMPCVRNEERRFSWPNYINSFKHSPTKGGFKSKFKIFKKYF